MEKTRKTAFLLPVLVLAALVLAGSTIGAAKEVALKVWSFSVIQDAIDVIEKDLIPSFVKDNPGVKIVWQHVPYDGFREKLLTSAAAGDMPDIFIDGSNMVGMYEAKGLIAAFDWSAGTWPLWKDFMATPRRHATYKGKVYGVPVRIKPNPPIYNVEAFKQAGLDPNKLPTTWSELYDCAQKLTKIENGRMVFQGIGGLFSRSLRIRTFELLLQQNGGRLLNKNLTAPAFNTKQGLEALEYFIKLCKLSEPPDVAPLSTAAKPSHATYAAGQVGAVPFDGYGVIDFCLKNKPEQLKISKIGALIASGNSYGKKVAMMDGDMVMISSKTKNRRAAWKFIEYFFKPENHLKFAIANKTLPLLRSLSTSDYVKNTPFFKDLMDVDEFGWDLGNTPEYPEVREKLLDEIEKAVYGKQTPQEALKNGEALWKKAIEEYQK